MYQPQKHIVLLGFDPALRAKVGASLLEGLKGLSTRRNGSDFYAEGEETLSDCNGLSCTGWRLSLQHKKSWRRQELSVYDLPLTKMGDISTTIAAIPADHLTIVFCFAGRDLEVGFHPFDSVAEGETLKMQLSELGDRVKGTLVNLLWLEPEEMQGRMKVVLQLSRRNNKYMDGAVLSHYINGDEGHAPSYDYFLRLPTMLATQQDLPLKIVTV